MAEIVVERLLSSVFKLLFEKLAAPHLRRFFRSLKVNEGLLRKLKTMLWSANQVLDDAEEKQLTKPDVREWLFELKDTVYEAEDVLDEINYRALQYEQRGKQRNKPLSKRFRSFLNCFSTFDEAIERKIMEILDRLKFIVEQKDVLGLQQGVTSRLSIRLPAPLADESYVYGRNDDKEKIMELLLSDNGSSSNNISVIPITGMGGIGKTTLAQLVYEDNRVKNQFHIRSWVAVSDESDVSIIAKAILKEITPKKCEIGEIEGLYQLQCELKKQLSGKRFLFVLDDVWNENYEQWDALLSSFRSGARGSRIIVTTRSDNVADKMGNLPTYHLKTVSDDECWNLFADHAFKNASSETYPELQAIGRDIVKKCKGVPLAVKSLASLARSVLDPNEWKKILNDDIWEWHLRGKLSNNILPSLWLSYHYLPSHLKRCFAYCSMFPKDYKMNELRKKEVILLWMAEGLVLPEIGGKQLEGIGNEYFRDLISRSLFQPLSKDKSTILMHDLTHDLAVFVSGEFSFRLDDKSKTKFSCKTRHLSYSKIDEFENIESLSEAKCIRSCLRLSSSSGGSSSIARQLDVLLSVGGCLRALCLSGCSFRVLPDSIGNLKHLRYLDLSSNNNIEEIPNMLCCLYNLQTLKLSWCTKLTQLPTEMGNLINLRHLDIQGVPLEKMPPKMCNLKDLQTLSNFVLGEKGGSRIKDLGWLHYLSGALEFSKLQNADVDRDDCEANLKDKEYLSELVSELVFCWSLNHDSRKDREVLDELKPHSNLKGLKIDGYGAATFSNWIGHCSYANIITMSLENCYNCCLLPSLGQLPSLQKLAISSCGGVERIGAEFYYYGGSSNIQPFRSLKSLHIEDMPEWQEWSIREGHEDGGCFPKLEYLHISDCPKLSIWSPDYFPSLKTLEIQDSEKIAVLPGIQQMETAFPSLDLLYINNCPILETFLLINLPASLKELHLFGYDMDFYYPQTIFPPCFTIGRYKNVTMFPEAPLPTTLTCLRIHGLWNLQAINGEGFQHLSSLKVLEISGCESLKTLSENALPVSLTSLSLSRLPSLEDVGRGFFQHLISLKQLEIMNCVNLRCSGNGNGGIQHLISLKKLTIQDCEKLQSLLEEGLPTSLTFLHIKGFPNLRELSHMGFRHLNSLIELEIDDCENLQCLPAEGLPLSLSSLYIYACPLLVPRCQEGTGEDWHKISHIPRVKIQPNQRNYVEELHSSIMSSLSG